MATESEDWAGAQPSEHDLFVRATFAVPEDEVCIDYFSCALQQTILMHGFLYVTYSHLCFYSNILGIVTQLLVPLSQVAEVQATVQAFINPGVAVRAGCQTHEFFSFTDRAFALELITNIWQFRQLGLRARAISRQAPRPRLARG